MPKIDVANLNFEELSLEAMVEIAQSSPLGLARIDTQLRYEAPLHLQLLDDKLLELDDEESDLQNIIVCLQPQVGKSEIANKYHSAWHLGKHPSDEIITASYNDDFSAKWCTEVRTIMRKTAAPIWGLQLSKEIAGKTRWALTPESGGGGQYATGIGGAPTGRRGDLLILDDAIKTPKEADSLIFRDSIWEWFTSTFYTRRSPKAKVVIILTRWHQDDIVGRILNSDLAHRFHYFEAPAISIEGEEDILERGPGEALWPGRYDINFLNDQKSLLGMSKFSALYQQRPVGADNLFFDVEKIKIIKERDVPEGLSWHRYWDLAISQKDEASNTATIKVALDGKGNIYAKDAMVGKWSYPEQRELCHKTAVRETYKTSLGIEKPLHGTALTQDLYPLLLPHGIAAEPVDVDKDKRVRAQGVQVACNNGMLHFVEGGWNEGWIFEMAGFDKGRYDDRVDALSGAWLLAAEKLGLGAFDVFNVEWR